MPDLGRCDVSPLVLLAPSGAPAGRYALYRSTGASCSNTSVRWADYLRTQSIFTYTLQSSSSLGSLAVALEVRIKQTGTTRTFKLGDSIVLRNSMRSCITGVAVAALLVVTRGRDHDRPGACR